MGGKTGASRFGQGVKESTDPISPLQYVSERLKARPSQIAIAWPLRKSPGDAADSRYHQGQSALIELDDALMEEMARLSKSFPAEAA
jgi:aryl-alcohol dehydrogenase-like predicted oxidoreductase